MSEIAENLARVKSRVQDAAKNAGRSIDEVSLMVVSKTWPAETVHEVAAAGQVLFGENRLQEGEEKIPQLGDHLEWHFIGALQRNKVRKVLPLFQIIHSISSMKLARFVDRVAGELGLKPRVYCEVNLGEEENKHGFTVTELLDHASEIQEMKNLHWEGVMCIPPQAETPAEARPWFRRLREVRDELVDRTGQSLPGLSMGMSSDFEVAIDEGSTIVRVGSAIFGKRQMRKGNRVE